MRQIETRKINLKPKSQAFVVSGQLTFVETPCRTEIMRQAVTGF